MVAVRVVVSLLCLFLTLLKNYYDGGRETEDICEEGSGYESRTVSSIFV